MLVLQRENQERDKGSGADTQSRTGDLTLTKGALYQLSHISTQHVFPALLCGRSGPTIRCPAVPYSRMGRPHTTIGATAFHF